MLKFNCFAANTVAILALLGTNYAWSVSPASKSSWTDTQNHWTSLCLESLATKKIVSGYPDGTFKPQRTVTRAEFAAMLDAMFTQPMVRPAIQFIDVPTNHWASATINRVYQKGLLTGYPDREFKPDQPIPRVQALVALANSLQYQQQDFTPQTWQTILIDHAEIPDYARGAVAAAIEQSLVVNYPNRRQLEPNRPATRAEIAAFFCQAIADTAGETIPDHYIAQGIPKLDHNVPEEVKQRYYEDAAQIAMSLLPMSVMDEQIELPADLVQTLYNVLIRVYQAKELSGRDQVVEDYQIQVINPNVRQIVLRVKQEESWVQAWREGKILTGNAEVDQAIAQYIAQYDLELESYQDSSSSGEESAILRAKRPLNTIALAQQFRNLGIYAYVNGIIGSNSHISAEFKDDRWELNYQIGYGDCPSGCKWWTTWKFHVPPNLPVEFVGRYGSVPPAPGAELSENIIEGRSLILTTGGAPLPDNFPRPEPRPFPALIEVLDEQGKEVTIIQPNANGDFAIRLEPGTYLFRVKTTPEENIYLAAAEETVNLKLNDYLKIEMVSNEIAP